MTYLGEPQIFPGHFSLLGTLLQTGCAKAEQGCFYLHGQRDQNKSVLKVAYVQGASIDIQEPETFDKTSLSKNSLL